MYARNRLALNSLALLALLLSSISPPSWAQLSPLGDEFAVNSYTPGDQSNPTVATNAGGGAVAVWAGNRPFPFTSTERAGIFSQRFDGAGRPVGPEFAAVWLNKPLTRGPAVAIASNGSFVVVWGEQREVGGEDRLLISGFSPRGSALFSRVEVDASLDELSQAKVAMAADGAIAVTWVRWATGAEVFARGFLPDGTAAGPAARISPAGEVHSNPDIAALADGRYVVVWQADSAAQNGVVARILRADGVAAGSNLVIADDAEGAGLSPAVTALGSASFAVVWQQSLIPKEDVEIYGRVFDDAGSPRGEQFAVSGVEADYNHEAASVAAGSGRLLVGWSRRQRNVFPSTGQPVLRAFSLDGEPLSSRLTAGSGGLGADTRFRLASVAPDRFLAVWERGPVPPGSPLSAATSAAATVDDDGTSILGRLFQFSSDSLHLNQDRFRLEVDWTTPNGASGRGKAVELTSDTGYFWFFNSDNVELTVKVLDGRPVNGSFWVFYGSLTNVDFTLTVTDTETGAQNQYHNPQGTLRSRADTNAFPEGFLPLSSLASSTVGAESALGELALPVMFDGLEPALVTKATGGCTTGGESLCLNGNRFRLEIDWTDPRSGDSGRGTAVSLTDDTGYFWFFNRDNVELIVKVLDGRPVNGNFWVFFGALSDLEYTLTVTDTETGAERTYFNPPFELTSLADTAAF